MGGGGERWCHLPSRMSHMTRHSGAKNPPSWGVWAHTFATCHIFIQKKSSALGMCAPGSPHIHSSSAENYPGPGLGVLMAIHTPKIILALALVRPCHPTQPWCDCSPLTKKNPERTTCVMFWPKKNPPPWVCVESGCDTHAADNQKKSSVLGMCGNRVLHIYDFSVPPRVFV